MPKQEQCLSEVAWDFLYECPGGMEKNAERDKFIQIAKGLESEDAPVDLIINAILRAAFFQGQSVGREIGEEERRFKGENEERDT